MAYSFTPGQKTFIRSLAAKTGLNPRVIGAWVFSEMNGGAARSREKAGNFNWLNIAYYDSGAGALTKNRVWGSPESAAQATADFLKGKRFGASSGIRSILKSAGKSADQQIAAIARSGWASSGYEGGSTLRSVYSGLSGLPTAPDRSTPSTGGMPAPGGSYGSARQLALLEYARNRNNPNALLRLASALQSDEPSPISAPSPTNASSSTGSVSIPAGSAKGMSPLLELIYTPLGYSAKNGQKTAPYAQDAHYNHVHVAAGPKTVVALGKKAQEMGLHVGENPAFGGVAPVHVPNSYHYRKEAIDVSGPPEKLMAYAKYVSRMYGIS